MTYDPNNVFGRIIRGEIPCDKMYEDDTTLAFRDIHPKAPVHILVVPKMPYLSFDDMMEKASEKDIGAFFKAVRQTAHEAGVHKNGYRVVANVGHDGGQEVPHFHVHILAGKKLPF